MVKSLPVRLGGPGPGALGINLFFFSLASVCQMCGSVPVTTVVFKLRITLYKIIKHILTAPSPLASGQTEVVFRFLLNLKGHGIGLYRQILAGSMSRALGSQYLCLALTGLVLTGHGQKPPRATRRPRAGGFGNQFVFLFPCQCLPNLWFCACHYSRVQVTANPLQNH